MNKTGPQLLELSPREGFSIQEKYVAADTLYSQIKEDVRKRAVALDEAISQSTQVRLCTPSVTGSPTAVLGRPHTHHTCAMDLKSNPSSAIVSLMTSDAL